MNKKFERRDTFRPFTLAFYTPGDIGHCGYSVIGDNWYGRQCEVLKRGDSDNFLVRWLDDDSEQRLSASQLISPKAYQFDLRQFAYFRRNFAIFMHNMLVSKQPTEQEFSNVFYALRLTSLNDKHSHGCSGHVIMGGWFISWNRVINEYVNVQQITVAYGSNGYQVKVTHDLDVHTFTVDMESFELPDEDYSELGSNLHVEMPRYIEPVKPDVLTLESRDEVIGWWIEVEHNVWRKIITVAVVPMSFGYFGDSRSHLLVYYEDGFSTFPKTKQVYRKEQKPFYL